MEALGNQKKGSDIELCVEDTYFIQKKNFKINII